MCHRIDKEKKIRRKNMKRRKTRERSKTTKETQPRQPLFTTAVERRKSKRVIKGRNKTKRRIREGDERRERSKRSNASRAQLFTTGGIGGVVSAANNQAMAVYLL